MAVIESPTFLKICGSLKSKRGYEFELICNDYLKARYPNLVPWVSTNEESTIPGTPDAFLIEESGAVIAGQYGSSPKLWRAKLFGNAREIGDAEKVAAWANKAGITIRRLVFCTTAEIDPTDLHAAQKEVKSRYGFAAEICDLRRLGSDIDQLFPGIAARRLGIPLKLQHFMTLDDYIDSGIQRYWPKRNDIDDGKVFTPSDYIREIRTRIEKDKRCLLTGLSSSGKSVLAIAYALAWRGDLHVGNKHPEAPVFYLDAASSGNHESGESWVLEVFDGDYQNALFIVDNCHLSPAAVNAFCFQLGRRQLKQASVLLISTPKVPESEWEVTPADYFEFFERSDAIIEVQPESIYRGLLQRYSEMYRRADADRFVDVNIDFADENRDRQLENVCSHNLVAAHGLLEAWGEIGGQLSSISEDEVLNVLRRRHLTPEKAPALGPLCSLASFEISIHNAFIPTLKADSVARLSAENLLIPDDSLLYGRIYRIALHPQVTTQLFKAYIQQELGAQYHWQVDERLFLYLKRYLLSGATNIAEVCKRLYVTGAAALQDRLLDDDEIQQCISSRLNLIPLREVIRYSYRINLRHPGLGGTILQRSYDDAGPEAFSSRLTQCPATEFMTLLELIIEMNPAIAKTVLPNISPDFLAEMLSRSGLGVVGRWIRPSSTSVAAKMGYSVDWRKQIAEKLDTDVLLERSKKANAQEFRWFLRSLVDIAPEQGRQLLDKLTPETLGLLLKGKPPGVITSALDVVQPLYKGADFVTRVVASLDFDELLNRISKHTIPRIYWFSRTFSSFVPGMSQKVERQLDAHKIVEQLRLKGDLTHLQMLRKSTSAEFERKVLSLDDSIVVTLLNRSTLSQIATFVEYRSSWARSYYELFAAQHLRERFETTDLATIGMFLLGLERRAPALAEDASRLLLQVDLNPRIAGSDVVGLSKVCYAIGKVNPEYKKQLLLKVSGEAIHDGLKRSSIEGIQSIIHAFAEPPSALLHIIQDYLCESDLTSRIEVASLQDLGYLLWNIRSTMGEELANKYCATVDTTLGPDSFRDVRVEAWAPFLWTVVNVSSSQELKMLEYESIHKSLKQELENAPGVCMQVLGVISLVRPDIVKTVFGPVIDLYKLGGPLALWLKQTLKDGHPHRFALGLQAVSIFDPEKAEILLRHVLQKAPARQSARSLLTDALNEAISPVSIQLLTRTIARVAPDATG
jgi:hypothetical protein